jgi:REP-associated tyrosine transposase
VRFLRTLGEACERTGWQVLAWVLMSNHYHLLICTPQANLVVGMQWFQTTLTARHNRRHRLSGHLFGGRYKAVVIDNEEDSRRRKSWRPLGYLGAVIVKAPKIRAQWLAAGQGLRLFGCPDNRLGRQKFLLRLEERMSQERAEECGRAGMEGDNAQSTLKRGWYFGSDRFRQSLRRPPDPSTAPSTPAPNSAKVSIVESRPLHSIRLGQSRSQNQHQKWHMRSAPKFAPGWAFGTANARLVLCQMVIRQEGRVVS